MRLVPLPRPFGCASMLAGIVLLVCFAPVACNGPFVRNGTLAWGTLTWGRKDWYRALLPSRKVMLPVGVPEPGLAAVTVAVKVTPWPYAEELVEEETRLMAPSWLTVCVVVPEVLPMKSVSPP